MEQALKAEMPQMGKTAMFAFSGGSLKRNSLYCRIKKIIEDGDNKIVDFGGIMLSPTNDKVKDGAEVVRKRGAGFILTVAYGSVIDFCMIFSAQ